MKRFATVIIIILIISSVVGCVYLFGYYLPEMEKEAEHERLVREYFAQKLATYEAENQTYADFEVDVAFLGDSLTDGYDLKAYYPQFKVANRGIGGETTHGLEQRMQVSLYDLKPKVAVMLIGGNNLKTMFENYEKMLIGFKENLPDTKIVLCSLTAMGGRFAEKNQIASYNNVIIKKLAEKYGFEFVDLYTPLFDVESGEIYAEYTSDGAHLTPLGYEVLTAAITPVLTELLEVENAQGDN